MGFRMAASKVGWTEFAAASFKPNCLDFELKRLFGAAVTRK